MSVVFLGEPRLDQPIELVSIELNDTHTYSIPTYSRILGVFINPNTEKRELHIEANKPDPDNNPEIEAFIAPFRVNVTVFPVKSVPRYICTVLDDNGAPLHYYVVYPW